MGSGAVGWPADPFVYLSRNPPAKSNAERGGRCGVRTDLENEA